MSMWQWTEIQKMLLIKKINIFQHRENANESNQN